jgi:AcrR family transcriptional regulator
MREMSGLSRPDAQKPVERMGQRERNKIDKLRRIKEATQHLFVTKGFDETTTREIAAAAGVGLGTVFTYAENKRDLLFLIANDDLETAMSKARESLAPGKTLVETLVGLFRPFYSFFAQQPALSRLMLREMLFYDTGVQSARFRTTRENLLALIREAVRRARADGSVTSRRKDTDIAWVIFCIYQVDLRRWVEAGKPTIAKGLTTLRANLEICMEGLSPGADRTSIVDAEARPLRLRSD